MEVFTLHRFRAVPRTAAALQTFHREHKYLLMGHSPGGLQRLGRIAAEPAAGGMADRFARYGTELIRVLRAPVTAGRRVNAAQHVYGYFKRNFPPGNRSHFEALLERFRRNEVPRQVLTENLRQLQRLFPEPYIEAQRFFEPYPAALAAA